MKKKLTRKDFEGLRQYFPVLSKEEMRHYVAGHSHVYDENALFLPNSYGFGLDDNLCSLGMKDVGQNTGMCENSTASSDTTFLDEGVSAFLSNYNGYSGGDDWFYHGFGGYDPDGNYHWYSGYTQDELFYWEGDWEGGWVYGMGYVAPDGGFTYGGIYDGTYSGYDGYDGGYTHIGSNHIRYDLVEGMGMGASFRGDLYVQEQNGVLNVICNVIGIPGYSASYNFLAAVEVYVNGSKVSETMLSQGSGSYIVSEGVTHVGSGSVDLSSYHGNVEVKVVMSGGRGDSYTGHSSVNGQVTVYSQYR